MFETYVAGRLNSWADWRLRRDEGGLGFPRKVSFLKVAPQFSGYWSPEMDSQAYEMDQCVMALERIYFDVIEACYLHTTDVKQKAQYCGCSVSTYYTRIGNAHKAILGFMNDLAAGVKLPVRPKVKKPRKISRAVA